MLNEWRERERDRQRDRETVRKRERKNFWTPKTILEFFKSAMHFFCNKMHFPDVFRICAVRERTYIDAHG
jgi:hypothetical protein